MSEVTVIPERLPRWPEPDQFVYHLPVGRFDPEAEWQPIHCGQGIVFPHREKRPTAEVCPDCRTAKKEGSAA